jgi:hypothetical protein
VTDLITFFVILAVVAVLQAGGFWIESVLFIIGAIVARLFILWRSR